MKWRKTLLGFAIIVTMLYSLCGCASYSDVNIDGGKGNFAELSGSVLYLEMYDDDESVIGTASGFLVNDGVTLVTNYHVIEDAYRIVAWTTDGKASTEASLLLANDSIADLAILKCDTDLGIQPLELGSGDDIEQGDHIFAIGYPLGLSNTVSDGIVSSLYTDSTGTDILQITAPISHGSSGGPLLDESGNVIGVICAYYENGQNLNLAVSISNLLEMLNSFNENDQISLSTFYNQTVHPKELQSILKSKDKWIGKEIMVRGYVSSVDIPMPDFVIYCIVCGPESVTGQIFHGYPYKNESEMAAHEYEWELLSKQQALEAYCFPSNHNDYFDFSKISPGSYVTIKGTLHEEWNAEALHDLTAITMNMDNVVLIDWE